MSVDDTICALATPAAEAALAVVRVSGPSVPELACACLGRTRPPLPRRATLAAYRDLGGTVLDHALVTRFAAGQSFTGEDVLEISLHGNPLLAQLVLEDLAARGCRLALPGEFTRRAYLNGKLDLTAAEAVADIIQARSLRGIEAAQQHLRGELGKKVSELTDALIGVVAHLEAYIDFPEEDLPPESAEGPLRELGQMERELRSLAETSQHRAWLTEGVPTVIAGAPNAGKSSLLNSLLGERRAIVAETPGTTRDVIAERLNVGPHSLRLCDTAGLRETDEAIEKLGIGLTLERLREAELVLLVADTADAPPALPSEATSALGSRPVIVVENKTDLPAARDLSSFLPGSPHVRISAITGEGIERLRAVIAECLDGRLAAPGPETLMVNARHAESLRRASGFVAEARGLLAEMSPAELAAAELRSAMEALGDVVGRIDNESVLDELFARFCIGK